MQGDHFPPRAALFSIRSNCNIIMIYPLRKDLRENSGFEAADLLC